MRSQPCVAPGDGADHITGLPMEVLALIASFLPFWQVVQLSSLSRPWRRIHDLTPVVRVDLNDFIGSELFVFQEGRIGLSLEEDDPALAGLEAALLRRRDGGHKYQVDVLHISHCPDDPRMQRHADRIIELSDAREIGVHVPLMGSHAWALDLPPSARCLHVNAICAVAPAIAGPGAVALEDLRLGSVLIREWPCCLLSLRSLTLHDVSILAPFPQWPLLKDLRISNSTICSSMIQVEIDLDHLESLQLIDVFMPLDITVNAPELKMLVVDTASMIQGTHDTYRYRSFTLRAPKLWYLRWRNQFITEHVHLNACSVTSGTIEFSLDTRYHDITDCRVLMWRMLGGLIPHPKMKQLARSYILP